jgi:HEPN domain-containing protein
MTPPPDEVIRKVREWAAFADDDLRLARHALTLIEPCPYRLAAYHAQQCAEKYLKAYLVYRRIDFPYTHNIGHLLELCEQVAGWGTRLIKATELTTFAITTRYPGLEESVSESDARRAIEIADEVRQTVRFALIEAGENL